MSKDTGGPAFPIAEINKISVGMQTYRTAHDGMTLRDWFAGQAMAVLCVIENCRSMADDAETAYALADAMIAERNKPQ